MPAIKSLEADLLAHNLAGLYQQPFLQDLNDIFIHDVQLHEGVARLCPHCLLLFIPHGPQQAVLDGIIHYTDLAQGCTVTQRTSLQVLHGESAQCQWYWHSNSGTHVISTKRPSTL